MIAVHGLWSSAGQLCLWGEDGVAVAPASRPRGRPARVPRTRPHPFALSTEFLAAWLAGRTTLAAIPGTLTLLLPTAPSGPVPSPELLAVDEQQPGTSVGLAPWQVPVLAAGPLAAVRLLLALEEVGVEDRGTPLGASLDFLIQIANLALATVVGGQVVPRITAAADGASAARWLAVTATPDAREAIGILMRAMPPVCRAEPVGGSLAGRAPADIVASMLGDLVDALARSATGAGGGAPARRKGGVARAWVRGLGAQDPTLPDSAGKRAPGFASLATTLEAWSRPVLSPPRSGLRTCFRLKAPEAEPEAEPGAALEAPWRLEFLLQSLDDRSVLVPAAQIWAGRTSGGPGWGSEAGAQNPEETLLAGLGRASRLYPALQPALRTARPSGSDLATDDAYAFLAQGSPLLQQAGFGVLVPPWWSKRSARLGVKLSLRPKSEGSLTPSVLGVAGIVAYEWQVAIGDETLSEAEMQRLASLKAPLVQLRGRWVELRSDEVAAALRFFRGNRHRGEMRLAEAMAVGLGARPAGVGLPVVGVIGEGALADLLGPDPGVGPRRYREAGIPKGLAATLRPYQRRGLSWLAFHDALGLGACLADDMGLGKTIQLLSLLLSEREGRRRGRPLPTLLVCPMSLVSNWEREASRFAPALRVHVHHGTERLAGKEFAEAAGGADLVLTTYALAVRDRERLSDIPWGRVVLDEAQNIKNRGSRQTQAVAAIPARRRVALTGTPVENRLADLWSIMEFLNPGLLGEASEFRQRFAIPVERFGDEDAAERLKRLTGPFILRRLKTDRDIIADLPDKVEMKVFCNLTREQATLYQAVVDDMLRQVEDSEGIQRKGLILATMTRLKQVCNHPAHLLGDRSPLPGRSGKLARLEEILEEVVAAGEKALCFTQFAEMGTRLRPYLRERLGREVAFLHGGTPKPARDEMVARFQGDAGPPVFLLSLKAGGTGLNLTAANHVIHFDRWWNPAVENQATDRAFRIGQRRDVQVRKFICAGTLEERIDKMIERKQALAERIVGAGEAWLTELSADQLRDLIALDADAVSEG
ncbi:MAG TPA: DEAD/DEAH box helicase [Actinomycetota bacterium]|nr:DEAD/DEAH box helicase [Actinomycetota bacterium]